MFYADALCTATRMPCLEVHLRSMFYVDALCAATRMPCLEFHLRSMFYADALCATTRMPCLGVTPTFRVLRWCPPSFLFICKVIGVNFNIMSAVFAHQQLTRSQIFNSRASFFVAN